MIRTFHIAIVCGLILIAGCDVPESTAVIDTRIPPTIIEASITPDDFDMGKVTTAGPTASVPIRGYVNVSDDNGLGDIDFVRYTVFSPDGSLQSTGLLQDNGVFPDASSGDGKYTSEIILSLPKEVIGTYTIQYSALDKDGYTSNTFNLPLAIIYSLNHAPTVSNFIAPDTVIVPSSSVGEFSVIVLAIDEEGPSDIVSVSLSLIRAEDSTVVRVYKLYDDGGLVNVPDFSASSGDSIAGDNRYTLRFPVPPNTKRDIERYFNVFAVDQSGAASNTISKKVVFR